MTIDECVSKVRAFNRFYTVFLGILSSTYLNSPYSLAEVRIMHAAINWPGITPKELADLLKVDKSYLSRMVLRLNKQKILLKERSTSDRRSVNLYITTIGRREFQTLDNKATDEMRALLISLTDKDCISLINSMRQIEQILSPIQR